MLAGLSRTSILRGSAWHSGRTRHMNASILETPTFVAQGLEMQCFFRSSNVAF
jgi:hypothetical protein